MLKRSNDKSVISYVLTHLREEDKQELMALYYEKWEEKMLENLATREFFVLYGLDDKKRNVPIAIGDVDSIFEKTQRIACVWLLSTVWVKQNKRKFFNTIKQQLLFADKDFDILFNFVYESNNIAKKWIKKLGFCFDNPKPIEFSVEDGFEFFYKAKERKG